MLRPVAGVASITIALLPFTFQNSKKSALGRALDWIKANALGDAGFSVHDLAPNDYCYIYLKNDGRAWPSEESAGATYVLSRERKRPGARREFTAGDYIVWRQRS